MTNSPVPMQKRADLPERYAYISLLPILIFLLSEIILYILANNSVLFSENTLVKATFSEPGEAASRLKMIGMALLVLISAVAINLKFASDIKTYFVGSAKNTLFFAYGLVASIGILFIALEILKSKFSFEAIRIPRERMGDKLFDLIFEQVPTIVDRSPWGKEVYTIVLGISHVAIILSIAALIAGAISCLAKLPALSDKENWKYQSDRLKTYIFVGAAFLVVSVLYFKSWADYPAFLLASKSTESEFLAYGALSDAYTSFTGIEYSLILAAYALPISYIQARKADAIAMTMMGKTGDVNTVPFAPTLKAQVSSIKRKEGLELSLADVMRVILAILGPLMTGALTNLATAIS